jgi:hypothetical protein
MRDSGVRALNSTAVWPMRVTRALAVRRQFLDQANRAPRGQPPARAL